MPRFRRPCYGEICEERTRQVRGLYAACLMLIYTIYIIQAILPLVDVELDTMSQVTTT